MPSAGLPPRRDSQITHNYTIILTDSMDSLKTRSENWNGEPTLTYVNVPYPPSKTPVDVLPWTCLGEGTDRAGKLAVKATITSGLRLARSEVMRSFRHYQRAQSQRYHIFDPLRRRKRKHPTIFLERRGKGHLESDLELFHRQPLGIFWEKGWSA